MYLCCRLGPSEFTSGHVNPDGEIDEPAFPCNSSLEEHNIMQEGAYGRGQPPRPTYPDLYSWTTPPMPFHGRTNGQLTTLIESQKELMSMFKDMGERLSSLESTVSALQSQVDSGPSSYSSPEEKKRVPSQLTVSYDVHPLCVRVKFCHYTENNINGTRCL